MIGEINPSTIVYFLFAKKIIKSETKYIWLPFLISFLYDVFLAKQIHFFNSFMHYLNVKLDCILKTPMRSKLIIINETTGWISFTKRFLSLINILRIFYLSI